MPRIIEETDDILAVDKPAGLIAHGDGRTVEPSLAAWLLQKYPGLDSVAPPWISPQGEGISIAGMVHRLDRTTSGVLLVAKTQQMYEYLRGEFKARRTEKKYRAFVYGKMRGEGKIVAEIMRTSEKPRRWYARPCPEEDNRAAITIWRSLESFESASEPVSYVELEPKTGRTHQIRVHLASIGYPIVADHVYAPDRHKLLGFERPALHAYSIAITINNEKKTFTAPLPPDFEQALSAIVG